MGRVQGRLPIIGISCVALFITMMSFAQQPKVLVPHKPIAPRVEKRSKWMMPQTPRSMVGGLWMTDANLKSSIYIRNVVETDPVTVTPILWLSNGKQYTLQDATIDAAGVAIISINDALEKQGISPQATLSGYVELQYLWPWDPFCATVRNVDTAHSVIFTYALRATQPPPGNIVDPPPPPPTNVAEGMWWKQQASVTAFVAIANLSSDPAKASVQVTDSQAKPIAQHDLTISPHGMKLISLDELQSIGAGQGGVRVTSSQTTDNLVISGGLEDQQTGYSAVLPFETTGVQDKPEPVTVAEIGLMAGAADPMMQFPAGTTFAPYTVLRNVADTPLSLVPTLWWMESGAPHSAELPAVSLQAYETGSLDVASLLAQFGPKNFNGSFNLVFNGAARRGSLVMASGSVDQTNTYVFEVGARAVAESVSKSLQYWSTGNGDDTMVTVWNPADEAQDFVFTLYFAGGHYALPLHLEARATRTFDISQIIQNQVPDADGNIIPASVHEGTATIAGSSAKNETILIAVEAGIYNVRKATCQMVCETCNGLVGVAVVPGSFTVPVGGTTNLYFLGTDNSGQQYNLGGAWSSSDTNLATVDVTGLVHGIAPGSVAITAAINNQLVGAGYICHSDAQQCPKANFASGGSGKSVPHITITNVDNNPVLGTGGMMTITGTQFQVLPGAYVKFDDGQGGISVVSSSVISNTSIHVNYNVSCSTLVGLHTVTVLFPPAWDGVIYSSNSWPITVVLPQPPTPQILLAGNPITGPQSVVTGQQIALSSSYSLPACVSSSAPTWSAAGTTVGSFNTGQQNGGPTTPDFAKASTSFYWVKPGASLNATFQYTMSGGGGSVLSPLATATFNVVGATVSNMSTPTGSVGIFAGPVLGYFGPVGIKFTATAAPPTGYTGRFEYVQLITNDTITVTTTGGTTQTCVNVTQPPTASGTGLDTVYPYDTGKSTKDSPSLPLDSSAYSQEGRVFSAKMYFLWDPALPAGCTVGSSCTSIPVPLGSATWGFSGTATYSAGNWSLTSSSKTAPSWSLGGTHPSWQDLVPYTGNLSCH